ALRLPNLHYPHAHASAAPPGDCRGHGAAFMPGGGCRLARPTVLLRGYFAGRRLTPYPAYGVQTQYVNRRQTWGR
ncbi:hypothetical protein, partial [Klebsiella pneumoniae]|uniref:hypothetical protein n=1 Tax=Klebsiella pneumoniae TaxID=573 RepID=UPI001CA50BDA